MPEPGKQGVLNHLEEAKRAFAAGSFEQAARAVNKRLLQSPDDLSALELLGDISLQSGNLANAIKTYQTVVEKSGVPSRTLLTKLVSASTQSGKAFDAVRAMRQLVICYPDAAETHYELAGFATMIGETGVALPSLRYLHQHQAGDADSLLILARPDRAEPDPGVCRKLRERFPDDFRADYGLAKLDARDLKWQRVYETTTRIVEQHPNYVPARMLQGRALVELGRIEEIASWQESLPKGCEQDPLYWQVIGAWAFENGQPKAAAGALIEALKRDSLAPLPCLTSLASSLRSSADSKADSRWEELSRWVDLRIGQTTAMRDALKTFLERSSLSQEAALQVGETMLDLGRVWEAEAWARLATTLPEDRVPDLRDRYLAIRSKLAADSPWQHQAFPPAEQLEFPAIDWKRSDASLAQSGGIRSGPIQLIDQAASRGWNHECRVAPEAQRDGHWIYQSVGGGIGVVDLDLDGWPDFAAANLDGQPMKTDSSTNQLYRNLRGQFSEVTTVSGYSDWGFSHGITIGDYNSDGFPDIFDCNIGRNRLYRNNGDGTFSDVSDEVGLAGEQWTTSAALADIDGDGLADLFEAQYCAGSEPYEQACGSDDRFSTCTPLKFSAQPDRLFHSDGKGGFRESDQLGPDHASPGRGLGVIVGQLDQAPGLDVYVANDMTANHLWSAIQTEDAFELRERGAISGLGFNAQSSSQASMGMAAGDPDRDGDVDFFLTHFSDDHNTYYEQVAPGVWKDHSHRQNLAAASMKLLGFGTEWIDLNNDGFVELLVANGHIDEQSTPGIAYQMPPQLFHLNARGTWDERPREELGDYFAKDHLGRALVSVDVDRDGRTDVAISHLYEPVALLMNESPAGKVVTFELKGTTSHRDAIGANLRLTINDREYQFPLLAGDGYMCSNQRQVTVGCSNAESVHDVRVDWPSGNSDSLGDLPTGHHYLVIESFSDPFSLQAYDK